MFAEKIELTTEHDNLSHMVAGVLYDDHPHTALPLVLISHRDVVAILKVF